MRRWDRDSCEEAIGIFQTSQSYHGALKRLSKKFQRPITKDAVVNAFRSNGYNPPSAYLATSLDAPTAKTTVQPAAPSETQDPEVQKLMAAVTKVKGTITIQRLCDEVFDSSPKRVMAIIDKAKKAGFSLDVDHDVIAFKRPEPNKTHAVSVDIPKLNEETMVGVFSDVHVGSKYHVKAAWVDHINHCYDLGIRDIFCPGDLLEGCYRHARFELSQVGWEDQANEALDSLPRLPGLRYHLIDGNHDFTFTEQIGMESGANLVRLAKSQGRNDLFFYGSRGALIDFGGTIIEMWHPKSGMGYAKSYPLQNHIRDTEPEDRPHILLAGHWHQYIQFEQGGVYAVACGTFQHGKSPFGKSIGGSTAIGGVILRWVLQEDGTLREFSAQHRPYRHVDLKHSVTQRVHGML
jgi:hypothetical protein